MLLPKQFTGDSHISILYWCSFWFFDCYTVQYITIQFNTITFSYILIFRSFYFLSLSVFLSVCFLYFFLSLFLSLFLFIFLSACLCLSFSLSLTFCLPLLPSSDCSGTWERKGHRSGLRTSWTCRMTGTDRKMETHRADRTCSVPLCLPT